jgi:hypothetical protein
MCAANDESVGAMGWEREGTHAEVHRLLLLELDKTRRAELEVVASEVSSVSDST